VTNSTFSGNSADTYGGGIANSGTVKVTNSTFSGNSAGNGGGIANLLYSVAVTNTILANSTSGGNCAGVTDGGHNLDSDGTCGVGPATDPLLAPGLAHNGGPTQTIALLAGSPAIDTGDPEVCGNPPVNGVDQRGYARPGTGHTQCSIGAYEADATASEACVGDCDGTGAVTIDELITLVNIALDAAPSSVCAHGIPSGEVVDITLIIKSVNHALTSCAGG